MAAPTDKDDGYEGDRMPNPMTRTLGGGSVPVPDPTALTSAALYREVSSLRELIEQRIDGVMALSKERDNRVDGMFTAAQSRKKALQMEFRTNLTALRELEDEKFKRVEQQFELVERQRVEQKKDTKDAVDAALTAQKEAVKEQTTASATAIGKSESATNKALEQLGANFNTAVDSLRRTIDEVKERISEVDRNLRDAVATVDAKASGTISQKTGATESKTGLYAALGAVVAVVAIGLTVVALLIGK
jgi:methyl-accepting chemotaxis protein